MSATAIRDEPAAEGSLKAAIIYDSFELATGAKATLERVTRDAGEDTHHTQWSTRVWRANLLALPEYANAALTDVADAHLLVLALSETQSPSFALLNWLETWAKCRQEPEAALALWDGCSRLAATEIAELSRFAQRHGLSLILDNNRLVASELAVFERDLRTRELSVTATLQQILDQPTYATYRGWGIND